MVGAPSIATARAAGAEKVPHANFLYEEPKIKNRWGINRFCGMPSAKLHEGAPRVGDTGKRDQLIEHERPAKRMPPTWQAPATSGMMCVVATSGAP